MRRAFDVSSAERNASLMEQFEIVLKRICSGSINIGPEVVPEASVGLRRRSTSAAPSLEPGHVAEERKQASDDKARSLKREPSVASLSQSTMALPISRDTFILKCLEIYAIVGAAVSDFVNRHKDFVLIMGAPGVYFDGMTVQL
jgi:hypothetical protein